MWKRAAGRSEEYGIGSFVYCQRRPFHPARFFDLLQQEWQGVIRSKGFFWLASRPTFAASWSQAGSICRHGIAGLWWAAVPPQKWPVEPESVARIREDWSEETGDARQELVLIGIGMDETSLCQSLDACLLTDAEMQEGQDAWAQYRDPFPW